jgi:hypothetical protein
MCYRGHSKAPWHMFRTAAGQLLYACMHVCFCWVRIQLTPSPACMVIPPLADTCAHHSLSISMKSRDLQWIKRMLQARALLKSGVARMRIAASVWDFLQVYILNDFTQVHGTEFSHCLQLRICKLRDFCASRSFCMLMLWMHSA